MLTVESILNFHTKYDAEFASTQTNCLHPRAMKGLLYLTIFMLVMHVVDEAFSMEHERVGNIDIIYFYCSLFNA